MCVCLCACKCVGVLTPSQPLAGYDSKASSQSGPYYDMFTLPKNAELGGSPSSREDYYSFNSGNTHWVVLNSYDTPRGPTDAMAAWIQADLAVARATPGITWVFATFHHPVYSKGTHNSNTATESMEMRMNIAPLLEAGGVDVVFNAHSHNYERSYLIDGHYGHSSEFSACHMFDGGNGRPGGDGAYVKPLGVTPHAGTVYVVAGVGANAHAGSGKLNHPVMLPLDGSRRGIVTVGSLIVDAVGNTLTVQYIDAGACRRWRLLLAAAFDLRF